MMPQVAIERLPCVLPGDTIQEVRHTCHRLLIVVKAGGLELVCPKCGEKVLYSWRKILTMMLVAQTDTA